MLMIAATLAICIWCASGCSQRPRLATEAHAKAENAAILTPWDVETAIKDSETSLKAFFDEINVSDGKYKLFVQEVYGCTSSDTEKDILRRANIKVFVFMDSMHLQDTELESIVMRFSNWIKRNGDGANSYVRFISIKSDYFRLIDRDNCSDWSHSEHIVSALDCDHSENGQTYFYRV